MLNYFQCKAVLQLACCQNEKHLKGIFKSCYTPLIKDAHKATQMSTFPFDYSNFIYIALQQYNVLLLVQVKQDKDTLRQTGDSF